MKKIIYLSSVVGLFFLAACDNSPEQNKQIVKNSNEKIAQQEPVNQLPAGHPQLADVKLNHVSEGALIGGVAEEVLSSGGYTYVKVTVNGVEHWAAAPMTSVSLGQKVAWETNAPMKNFRSSTLNRSFETVYFVSQFNTPGVMKSSSSNYNEMPVNHDAEQVSDIAQGKIIEVFASAGYTYIRVSRDSQEKWLAVPETFLSEGQLVTWEGGAEMNNFTSRSLNKTFESIWFVDKVAIIN